MYEDTLFDKITLQKEIDNLKLEYNKLNDKFVIETNELKEHLKKYYGYLILRALEDVLFCEGGSQQRGA